MNEYIDIVTETGEITGQSALKSVIHSKGYYHNTVHIWFYNKQGEVLLQQRAKTKIICPLLWDVSVAGHIDAGETLTGGAVREIQEEIGLHISEKNLHKVGIFECFKRYPNGIIDNEFHHTYIAELKVKLSELTPQKEEVEALKLVTISTFEVLLENSNSNGHFIASNTEYYKHILQAIKGQIN